MSRKNSVSNLRKPPPLPPRRAHSRPLVYLVTDEPSPLPHISFKDGEIFKTSKNECLSQEILKETQELKSQDKIFEKSGYNTNDVNDCQFKDKESIEIDDKISETDESLLFTNDNKDITVSSSRDQEDALDENKGHFESSMNSPLTLFTSQLINGSDTIMIEERIKCVFHDPNKPDHLLNNIKEHLIRKGTTLGTICIRNEKNEKCIFVFEGSCNHFFSSNVKYDRIINNVSDVDEQSIVVREGKLMRHRGRHFVDSKL